MEQSDKRRENRRTMHYLVEFSPVSGEMDDLFRGVSINQSGSGLCLLVFQRLSAGQTIRIRDDFRRDNPATVCWIKKLDEDIFKIGVSFN